MDEPEVKTVIVDVAADGLAVLSSDDGSTHTVMRWSQHVEGMSFTPVTSRPTLAEAWDVLYRMRETDRVRDLPLIGD
jgi:hypothetical protein